MTDWTAAELALDPPPAPSIDGPIRIGGDVHKALFCSMLLDTFNPYRPSVIDWPRLDDEARERLVSLPIWDIAVQTEGKASRWVRSYAKVVSDDAWLRNAVELNGFEEARHRHVLSNLVEAYGIKLAPEPDYVAPRDLEWAFMVVGFSECIDSFFAFGLFELAGRSGYFPPELVETFEPVMQEEGRHILFFVNWVAWRRCNLPLWKRPWFAARVLGVWAFLIWERVGIVRRFDDTPDQDSNFTITGAKSMGVDVRAAELLGVCLAENDRRLSIYDPRLLRPTFVPAMVRLARRLMALTGSRRDSASLSPPSTASRSPGPARPY